ncbi:MAG: glycosyltransferase 87 family protein [Candidatus Nanopelagicales bacterium]
MRSQTFTAKLADSRIRMRWWMLSRGFVLLFAAGLMLHPDWKHMFADLNVYSRWGDALAAGQVPSEDPMWQYPPLAAFVFAAIGLMGSQPWLFALLFVGVDIAISLLLAADARSRGRWHGFAVWLAAPVLIGPLMYGRYDSIPTLFALAGLLATSVPVAAGAILAVGGGLKVWPALMAMSMSQRDWFKGAGGAVAATAAIVATSAWALPTVISGFVGNGEARGLQTESVAALPFVWARLFVGREIPEAFRYGSSEVGVPLADSVAGLLLPVTAVGLLLLIAARALGRLDHVPVADIAFVAILWLMVTSRVLSPQYNVWLVGMAALVWAAGSSRMRRATLPVAVTAVAAQALYPFAYIDIVDGGWVGILIHTVRIAALVAAMGLAVRALLPVREPATADVREAAGIVPTSQMWAARSPGQS